MGSNIECGAVEPFSATLTQYRLAEYDQPSTIPMKYSAMAGNWIRATERTASEIHSFSYWAKAHTNVRNIAFCLFYPVRGPPKAWVCRQCLAAFKGRSAMWNAFNLYAMWKAFNLYAMWKAFNLYAVWNACNLYAMWKAFNLYAMWKAFNLYAMWKAFNLYAMWKTLQLYVSLRMQIWETKLHHSFWVYTKSLPKRSLILTLLRESQCM